MIAISQRAVEMCWTANCCLPGMVPEPSDPRHSSGHQTLQQNQHSVCDITSDLKSYLVTQASLADTDSKGETDRVIKGTCAYPCSESIPHSSFCYFIYLAVIIFKLTSLKKFTYLYLAALSYKLPGRLKTRPLPAKKRLAAWRLRTKGTRHVRAGLALKTHSLKVWNAEVSIWTVLAKKSIALSWQSLCWPDTYLQFQASRILCLFRSLNDTQDEDSGQARLD